MQIIKGLMFDPLKDNDAVLIYASHLRYGGGYRNHSKAQEEWCFNNSDLPKLNPPHDYYPLAQNEVRGFVMQATKPKNFHAIFVPAPVWIKRASDDMVAKRISLIYSLVKETGAKRLLAGAWGCGVFGCPLELVSREIVRQCPNDLELIIISPGEKELNAFRRLV